MCGANSSSGRNVNAIGRMDAVIHNAGVISGASLLVVNVVAPYLLTALIQRPQRLIYLSSGMHSGESASMAGTSTCWEPSEAPGLTPALSRPTKSRGSAFGRRTFYTSCTGHSAPA